MGIESLKSLTYLFGFVKEIEKINTFSVEDSRPSYWPRHFPSLDRLAADKTLAFWLWFCIHWQTSVQSEIYNSTQHSNNK